MIGEFHYTIHWRASSPYPGAHASTQPGGGDEFAGLVSFAARPDPRHVDLRASLSDPLGQLVVRHYRQRSNIPVAVIADLSASMAYTGRVSKAEQVARLSASVAWSAYRHGDRFGFIGCDDRLREELYVPLRMHKGGVPGLYEQVRDFPRMAQQARGLRLAAERLGKHRALVFLVSDFHIPLPDLEEVLSGLSRHDVIPVVVWDTAEYEGLPDWGLVVVQDPESRERRRLFMRPQLRAKFRAGFEDRRATLTQLFSQHGCSPFFMLDGFDPDALTRFFLSDR